MIISFTTSPTRIHKCKPMLDSLLNQTERPELILLNIPKRFRRTGETYDIPEYVLNNVTINVAEEDYGPATKIIPTIKHLKEHQYPGDTRIIYLDDDIFYQDKMVETIYKLADDKSIYTATGFHIIENNIMGIRKNLANATVAEGYGGVCVTLDTFEDDFLPYIEKYTLQDLDFYLSDDMVLSNYYHKKGRKIKIINQIGKYSVFDMWNNKNILDYGNLADALHNGADGISHNNVNRYRKVTNRLASENEQYYVTCLSNHIYHTENT